ncbi:hypothetical protein ACLEJQ_14950 [Pseudomonas sp. SMV71]|uniref:hypothetical protein n=1 Tax=Pseudomonas sp. SMV71 TaxID=3390195 RepID=UPI003F83B4E1
MIEEKTQYVGHYGLTFSVTRLRVMPREKHLLKSLCFLEMNAVAPQVCYRLTELYEKMLAKDLPCLMVVAISKPLSRRQADIFNLQKDLLITVISSAFAVPAKLFSSRASVSVGAAVAGSAWSRLRGYHAGDVIVGLDAQVNGGIGPQRSTSSMVLEHPGG